MDRTNLEDQRRLMGVGPRYDFSVLSSEVVTEAVDRQAADRAQRSLKELIYSANQADSALAKLIRDPDKFAPQLDNLKQDLVAIERQVRIIRRKMGI